MVIIQKIDKKKWNWGSHVGNRQKPQHKWRPLNERIVFVCVHAQIIKTMPRTVNFGEKLL